MRSIIFYVAAGGQNYELMVEHDGSRHIPAAIAEEASGSIRSVFGDELWTSLPAMTHELKAEIVSWGSDVGD